MITPIIITLVLFAWALFSEDVSIEIERWAKLGDATFFSLVVWVIYFVVTR